MPQQCRRNERSDRGDGPNPYGACIAGPIRACTRSLFIDPLEAQRTTRSELPDNTRTADRYDRGSMLPWPAATRPRADANRRHRRALPSRTRQHRQAHPPRSVPRGQPVRPDGLGDDPQQRHRPPSRTGIGSPVLARRTINLRGAAAAGGLLRRRRGGRVRYRATRLRCQRNRVSGVTIEPSLSRRGSAAASWGAGD